METTKTSTLTVTVVIPTRNEEDVISECLNAIFNQTFQPSEVLIVDGRSTDNTSEVASKFPVKILSESEPTSLPNARNIGAEQAQSDIVFIMDADVILDKNCIENAMKYFNDQHVIGVIPAEDNVAHSRLEKIQIDWFRGSANSMTPSIGISVFAEFLRKSIFEKVKFDPSLGYGEDGDFQKRLLKTYANSGKVVRSPGSLLSSHYCHTLGELRSQYGWYGRTFKKYLRKGYLFKALLNFGSLFAPTFLIISGAVTIFFPFVLPVFIIMAALIFMRDAMVCIRAKRPTFFEFLGFEFLRSFFFIRGLIQGLFSKKRGR